VLLFESAGMDARFLIFAIRVESRAFAICVGSQIAREIRVRQDADRIAAPGMVARRELSERHHPAM
jgi:hypothetical protein